MSPNVGRLIRASACICARMRHHVQRTAAAATWPPGADGRCLSRAFSELPLGHKLPNHYLTANLTAKTLASAAGAYNIAYSVYAYVKYTYVYYMLYVHIYIYT